MEIAGKRIGFALTGSFCTYEKIFAEMEHLVALEAKVFPIFSYVPQEMECRFGNWKEFMKRATEISGNHPITTIAGAEPIGPKELLDLLVVAPCTGNTLAKLSNAITDTPVTMAVKAHLRTEKPVVIFLSSNDSLGMNFKNVGLLYASKHIYFVPFGQDDAKKKPASLVAHPQLLIPTIEKALEGKQIQPVIRSYS
ncbi:MAG: dipicolinate synthase subunit B [Lachnospiraceae bacterium]|nr:dipicolinate synthase subunit B [Lachnospiraceae bacterium]